MNSTTGQHPSGPRRGPPLQEVPFCAVDLETTGGSALACAIVEIGAVRSVGGVTDGTFQTLVRPDDELPTAVQQLTGIEPWMLRDAPPIEAVLPAFLEFARGATLVAHNAGFDHAFLLEACMRLAYETPTVPFVDTLKLARRLLGEHIPNARLATLARVLNATHTPRHRAFSDAAACLDVLHGLIERASDYGITDLEGLLELQSAPKSPHISKARLARVLPSDPGVFILRDASGRVLCVGRADDLRSEVRSLILGYKPPRQLIVLLATVDSIPCDDPDETAAVHERLLRQHSPPYRARPGDDAAMPRRSREPAQRQRQSVL